MKKTFGILLVAISLSFATTASQFNQEQEKGIVNVDSVAALLEHDFAFAEMKLMPLDVFATSELVEDFIVQETCEGYAVRLLKPPISLLPGKAANTNCSATKALEHFQQSSYLYGNFLSSSLS